MAGGELTPSTSQQLLGRLTMSQRVGLVAAFAVTVGGLFAISRLGGDGPMALMFSDLDADSAATVVGELEARDVPYELTDGGRSIRVPADDVLNLRVELAANDGVATADGWSVLDDQGLTASEFDQRVGYQRALEGELARTISAIDGVNDADVHLVMPERDLFTGDDVMPTASVLLKTGGGAATSTQVRSIVNLVANSVEGLTAAMVSVTDERGRPLATPESGVSGGGDAMEQQMAFERDLAAQLDLLLAAVAGPGNAVATVSAQLDFDSSAVTTETYEELEEDDIQTRLTESTRTERYRGDGAELDAGILGPEDELVEGEVEAVNGVVYDLDEADIEYAVDKTITVTERAPGAIRALSVAVALNEESVDAATASEMESLVAAAVGFDAERGDTLALTVIPFDESFEAPAELAFTDEETPTEEGGLTSLLPLIRMGVIGLIALLATVFTALFALRGRRGPQVVALRAADLESDDPDLEAIGAATVAALGTGDEADGEPTDLISLIESQPDDVAGMLRSWMADDRAGESV